MRLLFSPVLCLLVSLPSTLHSHSLCPYRQSPLLQMLQLLFDVILLERDRVSLPGLRPEVGHGEARVEIRAEVVHDADWEHNVHAELSEGQIWHP